MSKSEVKPETTFADLHLRPELQDMLAELGYEEPTPIQREAIPVLLEGRDLVGQAATGTGKTAAFALPLLQHIGDSSSAKNPKALVLVPTRELAIQVSEAIRRYGRRLHSRVVAIYGGDPMPQQLKALKAGVDVVVATPGRAVDHINRKSLRLDQLEVVVLDEADEMLDMGFAEDLDAIIDVTPAERQTVLFSATLPARIAGIARRYLTDPETIQIARPTPARDDIPLVQQSAYVVARRYKPAALARVIEMESPGAAIVFCRTRDQVDQLAEALLARGHKAEAIHGGLSQQQRDRVMGRLRNQRVNLLIATDVAARGLDIDHLTHVFNYDVPSSPEVYVHRVGRVGRAGREGCAISFVEPRDQRMLRTIERVAKVKIAVKDLPTVSDVRQRRLDVMTDMLRQSASDGDLNQYRSVVESLIGEFDATDIALAAIKLLHQTTGERQDEEIPTQVVDVREKRFDSGRKASAPDVKTKRKPRNSGPMARVFVSAGRDMQVRPQDLVGAIANETSLSGRDIGHIEISQRFSLVEVPVKAVQEVIGSLKQTTIKGKKVTARRDKAGRN
jgi:ATP-dependent RNA helicase DeaD